MIQNFRSRIPALVSYRLLLFGICILTATCCKNRNPVQTNNPPNSTPPPPWNFEAQPVWTDEFEKDSVDLSRWTFQTGGNGWGNDELEYYTDGSNAKIENGILKIIAKKESMGGRNYTSSRMITKGKGDWLYGRFEIRARVPRGVGTWPAIWMMPTDDSYGGWPKSGEIDIMEHVGFDQNNIHFTVHNQTYFAGNGKGATTLVSTASDSFHVYRCDWTPAGIRGFVDGVPYFEYDNNHGGPAYWPYDKRFYIILNVAIGGAWGGQKGVDDSIFPVSMDVDYVRVYKWIP